MSGREGAAARAAVSPVRIERRAAASAAVIPFRRPSSAFPELDPVRQRFSATLLRQAEQRAAALALGADRVLIAAGLIDEEDYLHAFARTAGIGFEPLDRLPRSACALSDDRMLGAAAEGILECTADGETVHVVAPRGLAARGLLRLIRDNPEVRHRYRVTTAARLHRYVATHCGAALGRRAADALRSSAPLLSAAPATADPARRWWTVLAALLVIAVIAAPEAAPVLLNVGFSLLFLAWMGLRLLGVLHRPDNHRPRHAIADADLPVYTVVAAIYREAASVAELVAAIRRLDWPAEKLDAKLVVEADDAETRAAIAELDLPPWFEVVVAPPAGPRTKPKALNAALPFARGTFTVIYDAEDWPEPDQLRGALDAFLAHDNRVACVQAALTIDNTADSWLARMFTAEYAAHFDVLLPSLAALRLPLPLGGSSNHFRTDILRKIGGWDPHNVTEDADLGIRLARCGYRSAVIAPTTYEEAPAHVGRWLRQRTRWFKGFMQTWLVHTRRPLALLRDLGPAGFLLFHLLIAGGVLAALIYPVFAAIVAVRLATGQSILDVGFAGLHMLALVGGLSASVACHLSGLARRRLLRHAWVVVLMPVYWLLLSAAAWRAVLQLVRDPYRWEKTEHGLARSSRLRDTCAAPPPPHPRRA